MTVNDNPPTPPTADTPAVAATKDVEVIAQRFRDAIAILLTIMPDLLKYDAREIRRIAASAKFADGLLTPAIFMTTAASPAKQRNMFDPYEGEYATALRDQVGPLMLQLGAFVADVEFTILNKLAVASVHALQMYKWAQHAANQPDGAELHPFVADMERVVMRALNRRKRRSASPAPEPAPQPPVAQGFLAPNLGSRKPAEPENVADSFDQALDDAGKK
jgi:hypothetical protein